MLYSLLLHWNVVTSLGVMFNPSPKKILMLKDEVDEQNNLHTMKTTDLDETNALQLPNESQLFPKQIAELGLPYSCVIVTSERKGVQQGNLIIL